MMNGVSSVGVNNQNYQMSFRAKGVNKQKAMEVVDKLGIQMPRDMELSRRPIEEQRETLIKNTMAMSIGEMLKNITKDILKKS